MVSFLLSQVLVSSALSSKTDNLPYASPSREELMWVCVLLRSSAKLTSRRRSKKAERLTGGQAQPSQYKEVHRGWSAFS